MSLASALPNQPPPPNPWGYNPWTGEPMTEEEYWAQKEDEQMAYRWKYGEPPPPPPPPPPGSDPFTSGGSPGSTPTNNQSLMVPIQIAMPGLSFAHQIPVEHYVNLMGRFGGMGTMRPLPTAGTRPSTTAMTPAPAVPRR